MIKQIMIPAAAFLVTATGVSAFNSDMLEKANIDLTDSEVAALETAHEMRQDGAERDEVKAVLEAAGLDRDDMREIREAVREVHQATRADIKDAVEAGDYEAFKDAAEGTPLLEAIESEADFDLFVEAHELKEAGDREGAKEIMDGLGIQKPGDHEHDGGHEHGGGRGPHGEHDDA